MVEPKELLPLGFSFIDGLPEALIYYLNESKSACITYTEGIFNLGINACCWTTLNIENINDLILAIELLQDGDPVC